MKIKLLSIVFLLFYSLNGFACLDARQHKIFPIGILDGQIITFEAHLHRTHDTDKDDSFGLKAKWLIKSYISVYDNSQKLISKTAIEEAEVKGNSYLPLLQKTYSKGLQKIKTLFEGLDYFSTDYISFCDYQKKCKRLDVKRDSIAKKDSFSYKNKDYLIKLSDNKKNKESALFTDDLSSYFLSSIRVYKAKNIELVIGHLATGHGVSMGWITNDSNKKTTEHGDPIEPRKEHKPDFKFNNLYTAVYQEPLMHHGYGFDFFIVKTN